MKARARMYTTTDVVQITGADYAAIHAVMKALGIKGKSRTRRGDRKKYRLFSKEEVERMRDGLEKGAHIRHLMFTGRDAVDLLGISPSDFWELRRQLGINGESGTTRDGERTYRLFTFDELRRVKKSIKLRQQSRGED